LSPKQLIQRKPERRLGANGIEEILHHPWLKGFPWDDLLKKKLNALYVPGVYRIIIRLLMIISIFRIKFQKKHNLVMINYQKIK
jgi:hypothetical protein